MSPNEVTTREAENTTLLPSGFPNGIATHERPIPSSPAQSPVACAITIDPASESSSVASASSSNSSRLKNEDNISSSPHVVDLTVQALPTAAHILEPKGGLEDGYVPVESPIPDARPIATPLQLTGLEGEDLNASMTGSRRSVRFRSRVRITSGLHRHKRPKQRPRLDDAMLSPDTDYFSSQSQAGSTVTTNATPGILTPGPTASYMAHVRRLSNTSSISSLCSGSSSPSSSISAPLKYRRDSASTHASESGDDLGWRGRRLVWKPLGQRINSYQSSTEDGERSGLLRSSNRRQYGTTAAQRRAEAAEEADEYAREIDMIFGPWPGRLLNRRWWWWRLEPIFCCLCMDEFED